MRFSHSLVVWYYKWLFATPYHFLIVFTLVGVIVTLCNKASAESVDGLWTDE